MFGIGASLSESEVRAKSWSKSDSRTIDFEVQVPAHEGRLVNETTTQFSATTVYEARVGVIHAMGIEVDPAWYKENVYWYFLDAEYVFSENYASSRVDRSIIGTNIDTTINTLRPPGASENADLGRVLSNFSIQTATSQERPELLSKPESEIGISFGLQNGSESSNVLPRRENLLLDFDKSYKPVPIQERAQKTQQFRLRLALELQTKGVPLAPPGVSSVIFVPSYQAPTTARLSVTYDSARTTRLDVQNEILSVFRAINWDGKLDLHFS